jgi:hypothetical protein
MPSTRWTVDHDGVEKKITLTVESTEPEMVGLIAEASARHGIELLRELAGDEELDSSDDEQFEPEPAFERGEDA